MLKRVIPCAVCSVMFFACSDETVTNVNDEAKENAKISFLVLDSYSNEAVDSVTVYRPKDGKSDETDNLGYSIWEKNEIGNYVFELSKDGYATIRKSVDVTEEGLGDVARVPDVLAEVQMYKLGANINGTILYTDSKTNNKNAASGVTVILTCQDPNIIPNEVAVKTDEDGNYAFAKMPAGVEFTLSIPQSKIDGIRYEATEPVYIPAMRSGASKDLAVNTLVAVSSSIILVKSNLNSIDTTTAVTLTFSQELVADSLKNYFSVSRSSTSILVKVSLSKDNKTVTIEPLSGKWSKNAQYSISGKVFAKDGASASVSKSFTVGKKSSGGIPDQAKNLKIALDGSYLELTWEKDTSATGYYIYYKTQKMSNFLKYTSTSYTYADISYSQFIGDEDSSKVSFIVLPYNSNGVAPVEGAKSVSYTFTTPDAQVSDLAAELNSYSEVHLTWEEPSTGSYSYRIYYKSASEDEYDTLSTTSYSYYTTSYSISNYLSAGDSSISFKVVPYNKFGQAPLSKAKAVTLKIEPPTAKVVDLSVTTSGNYAYLSWSAPATGSYSYAIYYRASSEDEYTLDGTTSSKYYYSDYTLSHYTTSSDTAIFFKVVTKNAYGTASLKNADSVSLSLKLSKVTNLARNIFSAYYKMSWNAPATGTVSGYRIYYKTNSMDAYSKDYTYSTTSTSVYLYGTSKTSGINLNDLAVAADTAIEFKVIPYNSKETGSLDDADSLHITLDPGQATNLKVTFDDEDELYNLTWTKSPKNAYGYHIYYKTSSMEDYKLNSSTTNSSYANSISILDTDIQATDKEISFKVVPYNLFKIASLEDAAEFTYEPTTSVKE